jgi:hypothetical protein
MKNLHLVLAATAIVACQMMMIELYAQDPKETAARSITVEDCHSKDPKSVITGGRRYSFNFGPCV